VLAPAVLADVATIPCPSTHTHMQISMLLMEVEGEPAPCPSLKRILSAGEALTTSLANQVRHECIMKGIQDRVSV
jgi:hypothetical protein